MKTSGGHGLRRLLAVALVLAAGAPCPAAGRGDAAVSVIKAERRCLKDLLHLPGLLVSRADDPDGALSFEGEILPSMMPQLSAGQPVSVEVTGVGPVGGGILAMDDAMDPATHLGTARVALPADPRLRPGLFARAALEGRESCEITIPLSAVLYGSDGPVVQLVRGNRVETRRIDLGRAMDDRVQALAGIAPGDIVIGRAGGFLRDGDRVRSYLH